MLITLYASYEQIAISMERPVFFNCVIQNSVTEKSFISDRLTN